MFKKFVILILVLIIFILSFKISINIYEKRKIDDENINNIYLYYQDEEKNDLKKKKTNNEKYIGLLKIDKINFKRGFYNVDSEYNTLSKTIKLLDESILPNEKEKSFIVLASHNGNSNVSFFKNLDKLTIGDELIIDYQNKEYIYYLNNTYQEEKDGILNIKYDNNRDTLVLITCNKSDKTKQTIYVSYRKES